MQTLARVLATVLLTVPGWPAPQPTHLSGLVFIDANGNGIHDAGERGLANVAVSNQDDVVASDASGRYRLPVNTDGVLSVSAPTGYRAVGSFWRAMDAATASIDFALAPVAAADAFTFIHASDTHISPRRVQRPRVDVAGQP